VIGMRLPVDLVARAVPDLVASLGPEMEPAAEAIRTTDLRTKMASRTFIHGERPVTVSVICKGSGMIHPQMATMLCFVTTDASISPGLLDAALKQASEDSFNTITVDGDMSTNDSVIALANGRSGAPAIDAPGEAFDRFRTVLAELCGEMARAIAADGEGAT